jgi:hypothetical protein
MNIDVFSSISSLKPSQRRRCGGRPFLFPTVRAAIAVSLAVWAAPVVADPAFGGQGIDELLHVRVSFQADTLKLERENTGLWVVGNRRAPADTAKLNAALHQLFALTTDDKRGSLTKVTPELAERFEAVESRSVIARFRDGRTVRLVLAGSVPGDYSSTYWRYEGKASGSEVYRTRHNASWGFPVHEAVWFELNLFPEFGPVRVRRIEANWLDSSGVSQHYALLKPSLTETFLDEPVARSVHLDHAGEIVTQTSVLILDSIPHAKDTAALARDLQTIAFRLKFSLGGDSTYVLEAGPVRDGLRALRHTGTGRIVLIQEWRLRPFQVTRDKLLMGPYHGPWEDDGTSMDYLGVGVLIPNYHFHQDYIGEDGHDHNHHDHDHHDHDH